MRIIRYSQEKAAPRLGAVTDDGRIYELPQTDFLALLEEAGRNDRTPEQLVIAYISDRDPIIERMEQLNLLTPVDAPEVWAAGVTYERSRDARNYEATGGKLDASTFYDKVYDAVRPELFFKSTAARTVRPGGGLHLRSDSSWQIPEPELGLVLDGDGRIVGYTAGNDLSCRDIEGENPLYLPQAKVWKHSCAIGPAIRLAETVGNPYEFQITCRIFRGDRLHFEGSASTGQMKRKFDELVGFLKRDNELFAGTVLLTGTCIVPPNDFTLSRGDRIEIEISDIGTLVNPIQS